MSGYATKASSMINRPLWFLLVVTATLVSAAQFNGGGQASSGQRSRTGQHSVRLYVFDCGILHIVDTGRFGLKREEVAIVDMSVPCFLVVHPKGTLIWDTGAVPDTAWKPSGAPSTRHITLPDSQQRDITVTKSLNAQLADLGYTASDITYLALSHYHYDHTANANQFATATWLVRYAERDAMFAEKPPGTTQPSTYLALRSSKTVILEEDEHDVFGDATVVIKSAPGHTPGHQILYLKLAKTGAVVLSGDLYHYPEERILDRVPTFEFDQKETRATRMIIETFLKEKAAQLWIEHDLNGNRKLKKSPEFYE
jgi:glyoxylase-like metal-dependent hydrolase (beta-lactamase superfamily II)